MIKLSKKTEYGILALRHISSKEQERVVTVREIAEKNQIPQPLLAKILQELNRKSIIKSVQGSHGGYILCRPMSEISLADIVEAIEGPIRLTECDSPNHSCDRIEFCDLKETFDPLRGQLYNFFKNVKLKDIMKIPALGSVNK